MKIYSDTHVHCYEFEKIDKLFSYAHRNLSKHARAVGTNDHQFVLFFTDGNHDKTWHRLCEVIQQNKTIGDWVCHFIDDEHLISASNGERTLILAPARQINSQERLEFLLLGCELDIADGDTAEHIINEHHQKYPIISPWGVGKWLGKRSQLLSQLLNKQGQHFMLGDNGGRPNLWAYVPHFKQSPLNIINGSDPLPIDGEIQRVGDFGVHFELPSNDEITLTSLLQALKSEHIKKQNFGRSLSLIQFVKGRIGLARR